MSIAELVRAIVTTSMIALVLTFGGQAHSAADQLEMESHALYRTIVRGEVEEFLAYCTRPLLVAEYFTSREIKGAVEKELMKRPVKVVDASGSQYVCNAFTVAVRDRSTKLALFQQLRQLLHDTPEHLVDYGRIDQLRELPQEPSYGVSGLRASNIEWIVTLELYKGRAVVSSVKVGSH